MPMFAEALDPHALASRCGRPRLASLPHASRPHLDTCRRILDGKGHPRPVSALRARMRPHAYLMSNAHSVHRRPTPSSWPSCVPRLSRTAS
ncbi:UNVERIFIED_CONTAM: hypothetical protein Sradi_6263100 [Sesamum radiatum]|uniref:Uncharacterized protein n=1 Tax=Sesamum radiatum TaxID=300843 RepID=A0AAW2KAG9_SESRA